ncbi:hypothetical protein P692DRAFT_20930694, partial [Suillus brevipes Sb2]
GGLNTSPSQLLDIPANFRILVASRPLEDIHDILDTVVSPWIISRLYPRNVISSSTSPPRPAGTRSLFDNGRFKMLAQKSEGFFEWARLACEGKN